MANLEHEPMSIPKDPNMRRIKRLETVALNIIKWDSSGKPIALLKNIGQDAIEDLARNGQEQAIQAIFKQLPRAATLIGHRLQID